MTDKRRNEVFQNAFKSKKKFYKMTKKEINKRFENGEILTMSFGIRQNTYSIGDNRITVRQFDSVRKEYKDNLNFKADYGGFTRHYYSYAIPEDTNPELLK